MSDIRIKVTEPVSKVIKIIGGRGTNGIDGVSVISATVTPSSNELIFTLSDTSTISAGVLDISSSISTSSIETIDQIEDYLVITLENGVTITSSTLSFGISNHNDLSNIDGTGTYHITSTIANITSSLSVNDGVLLFNGNTISSGQLSDTLANRPTASVDYRGQLYNCEGAGPDGEDIPTICLLSSTGSYIWRSIATNPF